MTVVFFIYVDPFDLYGFLTRRTPTFLDRDLFADSMGIELLDFFQSGTSHFCVVKLAMRYLVPELAVVVHVVDFSIT